MSVATRSEELEAAAYRRSARLTGPQGPIPLSPALWLLLAVVWGCAAHGHVLPVEPGVTFAAHEEHDGLVIDKMGSPRYVFHVRDSGDVGFWVLSPGAVVTRPWPAEGNISEHVEPKWENNSIRLRLYPAAGDPLETDVFARVGPQNGASMLSRLDVLSIDLRGTYQATLRGPDGVAVGWLRVSVGTDDRGHVIYTAVLPRAVDESLAAATAAALSTEVDWIEQHVHGVSRKPMQRP